MDMSIGQRVGSLTQRYRPTFPADAGSGRPTSGDVIQPRVQAVMVADNSTAWSWIRARSSPPGRKTCPQPPRSPNGRERRHVARAVRLRWRQLRTPTLGRRLLLGRSATLMVGANADRNVVSSDPAPASEVASQWTTAPERVWSGEAVRCVPSAGK